MPSKHIEIKNFKLAHTTKDILKIEHIEKPYGEYSSPIVSIGIYKKGKEKVSEIQIPYENMEELIKALNKAVDTCNSITRNEIHGEVLASIGGGA